MSFIPAAMAAVAAATPYVEAAATIASVKNGIDQTNNAKKAAKQNAANIAAQNEQYAEAQKKASQRTIDVNALIAKNSQANSGGPGSTMLTGTSGVAPTALTLGRNTLLGA